MSEHHSKFPPSSFPALAKCAHYSGLKKGGPAAERGTRVHKILADILRQGTLGSFGVEDVEYVALADWAAKRIQEMMTIRGVEERVTLSDGIEDVTFGTLDAWGYSIEGWEKDDFHILTVADMKTGRQRDHRPQIMVYALAKMDELGEGQCRIFIVYPDLKAVEDYAITRAEAEKEVFEIIRRVNDPEHNPPTECDYCSYCEKQPTCEVWVKPAREALKMLSTPKNDMSEIVATLEALKSDPPRAMKFIMQFRKAKELVKKSDLEGWMKALLEAGEDVPGGKLSHVSGSPCFTEEDIEKLLIGPIRDMGTARARKFVSVDVGDFENAWTLYSDKPMPVTPSGETNGYSKLIADRKQIKET